MLDRSLLVKEIEKLAPWYQRIEFPAYGLATTDDPAWVVQDGACDNWFPGIQPEDAAKLRPLPKYDRLRRLLPDFTGKSVLEVGCACGFFSLKFAETAKSVVGMDIDPSNVGRGEFCASVLGLNNVRFIAADVGEYAQGHDIVWGSSLHEHFFFPFYYLTRLLCLAREQLLLETHHFMADDESRVARLDVSFDGSLPMGSHGFHFSRMLFRDYLRMLLIPESDIEEQVFYEDSVVRRFLLRVDTREFQRRRADHPFLQVLRRVGVGNSGN